MMKLNAQIIFIFTLYYQNTRLPSSYEAIIIPPAGAILAKIRAKHMKEEKLDEKAPPGDKYERMVKHIKAKYSEGGLTDKEKSIAYATAWKAKNKEDK